MDNDNIIISHEKFYFKKTNIKTTFHLGITNIVLHKLQHIQRDLNTILF